MSLKVCKETEKISKMFAVITHNKNKKRLLSANDRYSSTHFLNSNPINRTIQKMKDENIIDVRETMHFKDKQNYGLLHHGQKLHNYFNVNLKVEKEDKKQIQTISKGLIKACTYNDFTVAGAPKNMKKHQTHKDNLSRLTDAITLFRRK